MNGHSRPMPPKKDVCQALLERDFVFVHLDPRREGVEVPAWFRQQPQLVLRIGYRLEPPIPDLAVVDEAITCTLSFRNTPFACRLPWSAIFALVGDDGRGMVWSDDVPPEVSAQLQQPATAAAAPAPAAALASAEQAPVAEKAPKAKKPRASRAKKGRARPDAEGEAPAPVAETAEPRPSAPPEIPAREAAKKPKRELPPYLRVIK